jgi:hypothetical protein
VWWWCVVYQAKLLEKHILEWSVRSGTEEERRRTKEEQKTKKKKIIILFSINTSYYIRLL